VTVEGGGSEANFTRHTEKYKNPQMINMWSCVHFFFFFFFLNPIIASWWRNRNIQMPLGAGTRHTFEKKKKSFIFL
jgi:hypothetical protein